MTLKLRFALTPLLLLAASCASDPRGVDPVSGADTADDTASLPAGLTTRASRRLQAGTKLFVLGVTDDDHAIYQDGTSVYATSLHPGARRQLIAETGPNVGVRNPLVFVSGDVALVWPDSDASGTIVSRLVVWTAATGPQVAASASLGFAGASAVSPDGRRVVFIANANADGTVGDLVTAAVDGRERATLVTGANVAPFGSCPPQVGFDRKRPARRVDQEQRSDGCAPARPVAGYCEGTSDTAVLSRWTGGVRRDVATDIHGFPLWSTDTTGTKLFTLVGHPRPSQRPIVIDAKGDTTVLEDVFTGGGTINTDDTVMTFAKPGDNFEMHRFSGAPLRPSVIAPMGPSFNIFFDTAPTFLRDYTTGFTSRAGLAIFGTTTTSPRRDLFLVDTTHAPSPLVHLQQDAECGPSFEPFSADSKHALVYCSDPRTAIALFDASSSGVVRPLSVGSAEDGVNFAVEGSTITFADNLEHSPADQDLSATVEIKKVDLDAATLAPTTLVHRAYALYFPSGDRKRIVFSSDDDPSSSGLFVMPVR